HQPIGLANAVPVTSFRPLDEHSLLAFALKLVPPGLDSLPRLLFLAILDHGRVGVFSFPKRAASDAFQNGQGTVAYAKDVVREVEISMETNRACQTLILKRLNELRHGIVPDVDELVSRRISHHLAARTHDQKDIARTGLGPLPTVLFPEMENQV